MSLLVKKKIHIQKLLDKNQSPVLKILQNFQQVTTKQSVE